MFPDNKYIWIEEGYKLFAKLGQNGLKIHTLSRKVKKSRASFYHHFADLEIFIEILIEHHLERAKMMAYKTRECQNIDPDFINLLIELKIDLLFSRQLRVNRTNPVYCECFQKIDQLMLEALSDLWAKYLELEHKKHYATELLLIFFENFLLLITEKNLNYDWLAIYFKQIKTLMGNLRKIK